MIKPTHELAKSMIQTSSKVSEPKIYNKAINDPIYGDKWHEAINKESQNLELHQVQFYKELLLGRKAIKCKQVFKVKYKPDGTIKRYKAYLVMQRFFQVSRVDFTKTFIPIIRQESLRIFLAIAALLDLILMPIDVIGAYLKSILGQNEQPIFMKIPQTI